MRSFVRALGRSYRLSPPGGGLARDRLVVPGSPLIFALWHDQILLAVRPLMRLVRAGLPISLLVSNSRDGELASRVVRPWGARVIRGSASRGGQAGLRGLYREIVHHGSSPLLLPDGPRGPRHEVKPGIVALAQTSRAPILPLAAAAASCWRLKSWDRMAVGHPFTRIAVICGEPHLVPSELDEGQRREECRWLGEELERLSSRARELVGERPGTSAQ